MAVLEDVKSALRISTDALDDDLTRMIKAGLADLGITDISADALTETDETSLGPLIEQAVITYIAYYLAPDDEADRWKRAYDEQKAQLITAEGIGINV